MNFSGSARPKQSKNVDKTSNLINITGPDHDRINAAVFIAERLENIINFIRDKEAKHDTYSSPTHRSI